MTKDVLPLSPSINIKSLPPFQEQNLKNFHKGKNWKMFIAKLAIKNSLGKTNFNKVSILYFWDTI